MAKIGLISDTHGHLDEAIIKHLLDCDEIWHAGDIGDLSVTDRLEQVAMVRAVYGNIDGGKVRRAWAENQVFELDGVKVLITHIGGYPGRYNARVKALIAEHHPNLVMVGHSHIVKVMRDPKSGHLHVNPGAIGIEGIHKVRTLMKFEIKDGKVVNLNLVELGKRGRSP